MNLCTTTVDFLWGRLGPQGAFGLVDIVIRLSPPTVPGVPPKTAFILLARFLATLFRAIPGERK